MSSYLASIVCRRRRTQAAQLSLWHRGIAVMRRIDAEVRAFEAPDDADGILDALFERPLLGDPGEPDTAHFRAAYASAQAQWRERVPREMAAIRGFVDAALAAEMAWKRADANARTKARQHIVARDRRLARDQQRAVRAARELLALALDPRSESPQARAAEHAARSILAAGQLQIPEHLDHRLSTTIALHHGGRDASTESTESGR
ncbi:hypothetical protein [Nocardia wallacei]|uniref:hypothetical protein n=1 Tax=Nocardia wallacei TaxID=480035 RepID=UPI002457ED0A|nr:hypothetical protein [Nocardia wallacei]